MLNRCTTDTLSVPAQVKTSPGGLFYLDRVLIHICFKAERVDTINLSGIQVIVVKICGG
jgi:hypothetical protein